MADGCSKGKIATTKSTSDLGNQMAHGKGLGNLGHPLCLTGEALGTARPHSFTAQNGLGGEQLQTSRRGDTTERHNGRHNRKMMQNEKS